MKSPFVLLNLLLVRNLGITFTTERSLTYIQIIVIVLVRASSISGTLLTFLAGPDAFLFVLVLY